MKRYPKLTDRELSSKRRKSNTTRKKNGTQVNKLFGSHNIPRFNPKRVSI